MPQLTDVQQSELRHTMTRIAHARRIPQNTQMSRDNLVTLARDTCDALGWRYDKHSVEPVELRKLETV